MMNLVPMSWILEKILWRKGPMTTNELKKEIAFLTGKKYYLSHIHQTLMNLVDQKRVTKSSKQVPRRINEWRLAEGVLP